jgi:hypothetical protein
MYNNLNRGVLFKAHAKPTETHPDYKGSINVNGVDWWLSAWVNKDGRITVQVRTKEQREVTNTEPTPN